MTYKPFIAIVKRELRTVTRERTIMIAIVIQLFIASFSSTILVGLLSFYDPSSIAFNSQIRIQAGVVGDKESALFNYLRAGNVRPIYFEQPEQADNALARGLIDTVIYVPSETAEVTQMQLFLPEAETQSTVVMMLLRQPLEQYENYLRRQRGIDVRFTDLQGKPSSSYEFLYATILPILMFFPGFVAGSMVADSVASELEHGTLETLWSAPISLSQIFAAKIVAALLLAFAQIGVWLILLQLNQIDVQNVGSILLLSVIVAGLNAVASAGITTFLKDRERAQFIYSLTIVMVAGGSTLLGRSPFSLLTQLATNDYYASMANVAVYGVLFLLIFAGYLLFARPMLEVKI
ncbi:MAG: ABC transporter permease [Ardenticatenaceae bacterium]|nr:ABC transporter permease [Anaerolineales bacterium]MCB9006124.1 ABC transporter permease [Ardenticatenaceae bacterium]